MKAIAALIAIAAPFAMIAAPLAARPLTPEQEAQIRPDGKPVNCLSLSRVRETRVRDDRTIDFYMDGGKVYRNRLPYSCPELGFEERFGYKTTIDQICSVDTITVLRSAPLMRGATCGLGAFQPIAGAPR